MSLSLKIEIALAAVALTAGGHQALAAGTLGKSGSEYRIVEQLGGDQVRSHMSFNETGGFLVTQDNLVDGNGQGIRARRYAANLAGMPSTILVNNRISGDQVDAKVAVLPNGGAAFTWQSTHNGVQRVKARFLKPDGVFVGPEIAVSSAYEDIESRPSIAAFSDGSVVIVWNSFEKDGSLQGVFARRFSSTGTPLGTEFQVNQWNLYNQRDPSVAVLDNDNFVVVWVSEGQRTTASVDIYGRRYNFSGRALGSEFRISDIAIPGEVPSQTVIIDGELATKVEPGATAKLPDVAARPEVVAVPGNGFFAAWSQHRGDGRGSWDVYGRAFDLTGAALGGSTRLNTHTDRLQAVPRLAVAGDQILAVWTSYAQDGADEGIYAQLFRFPLVPLGAETRVNTTTISKQIEPSVASYGEGQFVVAWSSFKGGVASFDLFGQRLQSSGELLLAAPEAPFVAALSQNSVSVTWPEYLGQPVRNYLIYVDGSGIPLETEGTQLVIDNESWVPGSQHTVQLAYQMFNGQISPKSPASIVVTWGADENGDGLPDDWQRENWGKVWPAPGADSDGDGASNLQEFLAGTDPVDPASVLKAELATREAGLYLDWNTQPGSMYQVQLTEDFKNWTNLGNPRFAHSNKDTVLVTTPSGGLYFRVIRMR